ncbi:Wadjet anti-phage system protein JetD domain-containing protein [Lacrimispora sp.]|uniref:Wadjet anti-phage system protein JetD domain-containing protein n=1 Tax=Lacrimispora sp. TaxID=2719234 RepID=UPI002FD8D323
MKWEEKILEYLVNNYRSSKKDAGSNKINRRTQVKPEKLYKKYRANDGDYDIINAINCTVELLSQKGFLIYDQETFGTQLKCIYLVDEKITQVEEYLHQTFGFVSKEMKKEAVQMIIDKYSGLSAACTVECDLLQQDLKRNKISANYEELPPILDALVFIENNQTELFVREASMKIYGDSKYFEINTLASVCQRLRKLRNKPCDSEEFLDEILVEYGIKKETQKLCLKGKFMISVNGKELDFSVLDEGIELDAKSLEKIDHIKIAATKFMTIENRTSYLRYSAPDTVTFYLGGYANRFQRDFIKKVYEDNHDLEYLHFGDIDAGGFWIHHNLSEITDVKFKLFCMTGDVLLHKGFKHCLHPLTDTDIIRLQELKRLDPYADTVRYMLQCNVKLEQEIVSLELMKIGGLLMRKLNET